MMPPRLVSLRLHLDQALLPLATSFAENAGLAYGLGKPEALKLTLAVEEVFSYLAEVAEGPEDGDVLTLEATGRVYCVELRLGLISRKWTCGSSILLLTIRLGMNRHWINWACL